MTPKSNLKVRSTTHLLGEWAAIMRELRDRDAIRSANTPTGDLAEALIGESFGVELEANSNAGYDLRLTDGTKVQIKGRRRTLRSKPSHYSQIRRLDKQPFDVLVVVNFGEEFEVESAFQMPIRVVRKLARYSDHTTSIHAFNFGPDAHRVRAKTGPGGPGFRRVGNGRASPRHRGERL
jgi:hypothetical protein